MNNMRKLATAYVSFFENKAIVQVFEAKNKIEAMLMAIISNQKDEDTKEWVEGIKDKKLTIEQFKNEVLQSEQSVDAIEI